MSDPSGVSGVLQADNHNENNKMSKMIDKLNTSRVLRDSEIKYKFIFNEKLLSSASTSSPLKIPIFNSQHAYRFFFHLFVVFQPLLCRSCRTTEC